MFCVPSAYILDTFLALFNSHCVAQRPLHENIEKLFVCQSGLARTHSTGTIGHRVDQIFPEFVSV